MLAVTYKQVAARSKWLQVVAFDQHVPKGQELCRKQSKKGLKAYINTTRKAERNTCRRTRKRFPKGLYDKKKDKSFFTLIGCILYTH